MRKSDSTQPNSAEPHLPGTVVECHDMIRQLQLSHVQVMQRLSELEERLKLNSRNSSKPPSSDGPEAPARLVRLFRNGANQALRIPKEFELPGKEAELRQVGNTLVITPIAPPKATLAQLLGSWNDIEDEFPDLDEGLLPPDDIDLGPA